MVNFCESLLVVDRDDRDISKDGKYPRDRPATPKEDEAVYFRNLSPEESDEGDSEDGDEKNTVDGWGF